MNPVLKIFRDAYARLGPRVFALIILMVLTGIMESASVAALLPVLALVGIGTGGEGNIAATAIRDLYQFLGVDFTPLPVVITVVGILAVNYTVFVTQAYLASWLQAVYGTQWQKELFAAIMAARWCFFTLRRSGDLMNALVGEITRVTGAFYQFYLLSAAVFTAIVYVTVALILSWQLTLAIIAVGLLLFCATRPLVRRAYRIGNAISADNAEVQSSAGQFIGAAKLIKATATESTAAEQFSDIVARLRVNTYRGMFDGQLVRAIFELGGAVSLIAILVIATMVFAIDAGIVIVIVALFVRLFPKLSSLPQSLQALNILAPSIDTLNSTLREAEDAKETDAGEALPEALLRGAIGISLVDLTVAYERQVVLSNISLEVPASATVALVGGSGAGKSTLVDCLLRLVEPVSGDILLNATLLGNVSAANWRRHVGYMPQDAVLFDATIAENIGWGRPEALQSDIENAARRASVHDFIAGLPDGYATSVGDRGVRLSGGERQRIALARALIGNPRLLILDEATSALDAETERSVLDAIEPLKGEITIILVAHRLSTCRIADRIFVLEAGKIVETGNWEELMHPKQRFRRLWDLQTAAGGSKR